MDSETAEHLLVDIQTVEDLKRTSAARGHPCFDKLAHHRVGRMHVPVAMACNVKCHYCVRELGVRDDRPGVADHIMTPEEALKAVQKVASQDETIRVVGVAGPGDSLANKSTFEALRLIHAKFPKLKKCVSTNGLVLPDRIGELIEVGVTALTVTVNAIDQEVGRHFYDFVCLGGRAHRKDAFEVLRARQLRGIRLAAHAGMAVKVNTVLVPELNGDHVEEIAREVRDRGACLMNIIPLKPLGTMSAYRAPTCFELEEARHRAEKHIEQFRLCRQCRADAAGVPGLEAPGGPTLGEMLGSVPLYH